MLNFVKHYKCYPNYFVKHTINNKDPIHYFVTVIQFVPK
jgi:hypothetical protein